jgi:predicted nucleic acid-binding protein
VYLLDTNVYLDAADDPLFADGTAAFVEDADQPLGVSTVVVAELLIGVRNESDRAEVVANVYATVPPQLVVTPIHEDWERAADALRHLGGSAATPRRSFWNDLLLAASCARTDSTLITGNDGDFRRIARHIPLRFLPPWP